MVEELFSPKTNSVIRGLYYFSLTLIWGLNTIKQL